MNGFKKDLQYHKFCAYGFLKNLKFFEAFIVLYFLETGLSFFQIGVLYAIREIAGNILEIPSGIMADAYGRRRSMIFSFSNYIISFVIFYFSSSFYMLALAMIVFAFGDAFRTGTHKAMIFQYVEMMGWAKYKTHYYGHTRSCSQFGSAISSLMAAGIVVFYNQYKYVFIFAVIPYLLDLLLMISYPKSLDAVNHKGDKQNVLTLFKLQTLTFLMSLKKKYVWRFTSNVSVYGGFYETVRDYLQPVIQVYVLGFAIFQQYQDKQRAALLIGIVYFGIYLLTSVAARNSGRISDKIKNFRLVLNGSLLLGIAAGVLSGVFYVFQWYWLVVISILIIDLVENVRKPLALALLTNVLDKSIYATALSFEAQFKKVIVAILAPLLGFFSDTFGVGYALMGVSMLLLFTFPLFRLSIHEFQCERK